MRKTQLRSTGYEFTSNADLLRDESFARYTGNRSLLVRLLLEQNRRRWSDEKRNTFSGLGERWYEIGSN